jgi:hypothetical protein
MHLIRIAALLAVLFSFSIARAGVVINEIFYHAPDDLDDLQWVELYNTEDQPVELGRWTFKGVGFSFPKEATIEGKGFLVIARDPALFRQYYRSAALGPMERPMSRSDGRIELLDAAGKRVDFVRYKDRYPWPISADGYSASLERICPTAAGDAAENWAASPLPAEAPRPGGTPGKVNTVYCATLPPVVAAVTGSPQNLAPGQALRVEAEVKNNQKVREVTLLYRVVTGSTAGKETGIAMALDSGSGRYAATIPAQKAGALLRYRVKAIDQADMQRFYPAENDIRPTLSAYVHDKWEPAKIPFGQIIHVRSSSPARGFRGFFGGQDQNDDGVGARPRGAPSQPHPPRGSSAFVFFDPKTGKTTLFDYVNVIPRNNERGYKVHFHKDHLLRGLSVVSIIFEGSERFLLAEALAYDVYRRAGNAAPLTDFMRLWVDGRMTGYHLMIEQPNRSFLRRNKVRDDGNLYKLIWYGGGVVGQHEKKTYPQTGHDDLLAVIDQLRKTQGEEQWKVIQENFNVDQVATYFAVNMVLSHWDGYFNNHFVYHDVHGSKKWEMYPWDQDKTWGHYDGIGRDEAFFDMPLTFGMEGDRAPGGQTGGPFGGGHVMWWRRGGYFSRPLLANPQFRKVFLERTRQILEKVYTKENYFPLIDELAERLAEDVKLRGRGMAGDAAYGSALLAHNLESLRTHLLKRREFLLEQPEIQALAKDAQPAAAKPAPRPTPGEGGRSH